MLIWHVFHNLPLAADHPDTPRNLHARQTWRGVGVVLLPFTATRTAQDIGDPRPLPYIKDLLDYGTACAADDDAVVWSNLDVCLTRGGYDAIRDSLANQPVAVSNRTDVDDATAEPPAEVMIDGEGHGGLDLFAFRPAWWRAARSKFPDCFIACEGFDWCFARLCELVPPHRVVSPFLRPRVLYHQKHGASYWQTHGESPANAHNRARCLEFAERVGAKY